MAYKDKDKQKQANKEAAQRRRDKAKGMTHNVTERMYKANKQGMTKGMTPAGMTAKGMTPDLPPDDELFAGLPDGLRVTEQSPDWKKDISFRRLIHHLKSTPIEQLEQEGIFIPCWRYAQAPIPLSSVKTLRQVSRKGFNE